MRALDLKREKRRFLMILSKTSYFTMKRDFCLFSWSFMPKLYFSFTCLIYFAQKRVSCAL